MEGHIGTVDFFGKHLLGFELVHKAGHCLLWTGDGDCVLGVVTGRDHPWGTLSTGFLPRQTYGCLMRITFIFSNKSHTGDSRQLN